MDKVVRTIIQIDEDKHNGLSRLSLYPLPRLTMMVQIS